MQNSQTLDKVTQSIISELESGSIPWTKPFRSGIPKNYITKKSYNGFNALILGLSGFSSPYFLTFNQCRTVGGKIKSGSKGLPIVFWKINEYATGEKNNKGEIETKKIPFIQYSTVFNFTQCEGLKELDITTEKLDPIKQAEDIINNMPLKPTIESGADPCYIPSLDTVKINPINNFKSVGGYYECLFHELAHSTGHEKRLNRQASEKDRSFGSEDYSKEELIAEFSSAFLCAEVGLFKETKTNQTAYIQGWLKALKNDKNILLQAGSQAQKAYNFIMNIQANPTA